MDSRGHAHRADAHRVDVVQVARLNSMPGATAGGLLMTRSATTAIIQAMAMLEVQAQHRPDGLEHVHLHQQQGDQRVEHHPPRAPGGCA